MASVGTWELADVLKQDGSTPRTAAKATVERVDADGTVWCSVPGGAGAFPCASTTVECRQGMTVTVEVSGGRARVTGSTSEVAVSAQRVNELMVPISDAVKQATDSAGVARQQADNATRSAESAERSALGAHEALIRAVADADTADEIVGQIKEKDAVSAELQAEIEGYAAQSYLDAQATKAQASRATVYANAALDQLTTVEDVAGTLAWISDHGTFKPTEDATVQPRTVYFVIDESGEYTPVIEPKDEDIASYYVLDVTESQSAFILAHLAVTTRGLWVLPSGLGEADQAVDADVDKDTDADTAADRQANANARQAPKYKTLLASDGMYVYDGDGLLVAKYGESIDFSSAKSWHVGSDDAYILYTPASVSAPATLNIGGANVVIGGTTKLSDLVDATAPKVGGTNLLRDSDFSQLLNSTGSAWAEHTANGGNVGVSYVEEQGLIWEAISYWSGYLAQEIEISGGEDYVLSFDAVVTSISRAFMTVYLGGSDYEVEVDEGSAHYEVKLTAPEGCTSASFLIGGTAPSTPPGPGGAPGVIQYSGDVLLRNLKFERGTIATDWSPAPEDVINLDNNLFHDSAMERYAGFVAENSTDWTKPLRFYNGSESLHSFEKYDQSSFQDTVSLSVDGNLGIAFARLASDMALDPESYYTASCWAKCSKAGASLCIGTSYYSDSGSWVWRGGQNEQAFAVKDTWQRFQLTFKPDEDTHAIMYCFTVAGESGGADTFTIRNCKLEKGVTATAWVPSTTDAGKIASGFITAKDGGACFHAETSDWETAGNYAYIDDDQFDIYHGGNTIAHFGYGEGNAQSGTAEAPYYTLGTRASTAAGDIGNKSLVEGNLNVASEYCSHAEGLRTEATGKYSHSEGYESYATGIGAHAEGGYRIDSDRDYSGSSASGNGSHAEGSSTASGIFAHAEGSGTASGNNSHAEGTGAIASGVAAHAQNHFTIAASANQTALGKYNVSDSSGTYAAIIGNGTSNTARSNALTVDWNGGVACGAIKASGQVKTSFKDSVAVGSYGSSQTTVPNLINEVRYSSGCMGSASLQAYTNGVTIPAGWYNFEWIPHRSGGVNGAASGDNCNYGILHLSPMNFNYCDRFAIHYVNGAIAKVICTSPYPVGAIYMSVSSTSPATLFGGTWERITGRFLLAATDGGAAGGNSNASIAPGNTGGEASHTLSAAESGVPSHGHGFTQPTVSGGTCTISSSGGHSHTITSYFVTDAASGSAKARNCFQPNSKSNGTTAATIAANTGTHTHTVPNHTHTVSGGAVSNNTAAAASSAHNNMPPYLAVYMWKRTA